MMMSRDQVFELITTELRAAGYSPSSAEMARMRALLVELDAAQGKEQAALIALRLVAHQRLRHAYRAIPAQRPASAAAPRLKDDALMDRRRG